MEIDPKQIDPSDPDGVQRAKANFILRAGEIDLLAPVRRHPFVAVGAAGALGAAAGSPLLQHSVALSKSANKILAMAMPLANSLIDGVRMAIHHHAEKTAPVNNDPGL